MNGVIVLIILIAGLAVGALVGSMLTTKRLTKQPGSAPVTSEPGAASSSSAPAATTEQPAGPTLPFAGPTIPAPAPLLAPAPRPAPAPAPAAAAPAPVAEAPRVIPPAPVPAAKFPPPAPAPAPVAPTPVFATASATSGAFADQLHRGEVAPAAPAAFAAAPASAPAPAAPAPLSWSEPTALADTAAPADLSTLADPAANHPSHNPSFLAPAPVDPAAEAAEPTGRVLWAPPPADLAAEVAKVPRRRREDFLPEAELVQEPLPQAELPPGFTDPITGLPLAEAMRADIELRATDFKTFTVVVCHPMMAMTTPGGMVNASPNAPFGQDELRVFAGVLRDTLRQKDIVGRYDERLFLLFLPRCKVEEVRIVMDRIRANLLLAQVDQPQWVDITFGAAAGQIGESVDGPLKVAYADLLQRNAGPAWFLQS